MGGPAEVVRAPLRVRLTEAMAVEGRPGRTMPGGDYDLVTAGLTLTRHPRDPHAPTMPV